MAFLSLGPPWSVTATEVQVLVESSEGDTQSPLQHRVRSQRSPLSAAGAAGVGAAAPGPRVVLDRCVPEQHGPEVGPEGST